MLFADEWRQSAAFKFWQITTTSAGRDKLQQAVFLINGECQTLHASPQGDVFAATIQENE